ncbi:hypothetical protein L6452_09166 [Arctium lappa]|uniref:Uncharacterized protein n=1 Tax=Arctium lappa TaxID=4217 RepID=A0ACB9DKB3_ARCLA|nr:hypothetical protein L6452_09166 [Arctium lappa]
MANSLLLVTAYVDKMVLKKPIMVDTDLKIIGVVTWVGHSSMEIQLEASRKLLWQEAEKRNVSRKKRRTQLKNVDCEREAERINALLAEGRVFIDMLTLADRDSILIKDTCLQNALVCQPQQRNTHGRIFGGFLMRRAFELAFATAYAFAGSAPCFLKVDVGNFLHFKSCVLYTELEHPEEPLINVEVVAHVTRPELRSAEPQRRHDRVIERMDAEKSLTNLLHDAKNAFPFSLGKSTQECKFHWPPFVDSDKSVLCSSMNGSGPVREFMASHHPQINT